MNIPPSVATPLSSIGADPVGGTADRDLDKLRKAKEALQRLKPQSASERAEERKAIARKKVEDLKAKLRMLQMSHPINAKALAQLARELKAAVKEYGQAGASTADTGAAAGASPGVSAPTSESDAATTAPDGEAAAAPAAAVDGAQAAKGDEAATSESKDGEGVKVDPYRQMAEQAEARHAEQARRSEERRADQEFLSNVRQIAERIKALAKQAAREGSGKTADVEAAEKAAVDAVNEAQSASQGDAGISVVV